MEETIAAISTAPGTAGIGIIRMSGKDVFSVLKKIFKPIKEESIEEIKGYTMKYGKIFNPETNEIVDEVLVSYFKEPKSYTQENMCEINSHGGTIVVRKILELCLKNGAQMAEPGEFTKRAFLNGRIDLAKAEAVINLINAKSEKETKASINQLEGNLSLEIKKIKKMILSLLADIEASIDYPEYDEAEEVSNNKALTKLDEIQKELEKLNKSFETGKIIKDGIKVAIIGKPNSGKSSLLNAILKEDRAIVTDIEGTTRDTIEEFVTIDGIPFKFVDTAGIRKADNKVEEIGIEKSKKVAKESDLIIAMFDNSKKLTKEDEEILDFIKDKTAIIILNKIDLKEKILEQEERITKSGKDVIKISLLSNCDLSGFYKELNMLFELNKINPDNEIIITEMRHKKLIEDAISHTENAKKTILDNIPIDIISINIKEIIEDLSKITGENVTEDVIKEIFSKFCLGK
ncbi:MAG TPA: tRNA uridine-5-carboxymethylaminomethyl(34) synthesis GTPase MnmE [Clostridiaceae bacterium]|nr:tRNA uridine-5-carboxymethylaminomethyl(34) synthesis GTPase MnmE [Clostridiaceae bacterium]